MDNIIDDTNLPHIESNADDGLLLDLDTEGFDNIELENIDSYRLQFIELPRILKEFNINIPKLDKNRLEVSLIILDCIYDDLDKIEFEFYRIENHDCLLLDFGKINLHYTGLYTYFLCKMRELKSTIILLKLVTMIEDSVSVRLRNPDISIWDSSIK